MKSTQNCIRSSFGRRGVQARSRHPAAQGLRRGPELRDRLFVQRGCLRRPRRPPRRRTTLARSTSTARSAITATSARARTTASRTGIAAAGQTCDIRGRCATPAAVNAAGAARAADRRPRPSSTWPPGSSTSRASPKRRRSPSGTSATVRLTTGSSPTGPGSRLTPLTGTIAAGASADVTIIGRAGRARGRAGRSPSSAPAGRPRCASASRKRSWVSTRAPFTSRCRRTWETRALALGLAQDGAGQLVGVVDDARSPAFGFRAALDASSRVSRQIRSGSSS